MSSGVALIFDSNFEFDNKTYFSKNDFVTEVRIIHETLSKLDLSFPNYNNRTTTTTTIRSSMPLPLMSKANVLEIWGMTTP